MKVDGVSLNSVNFGDNQSDSNNNNQNNTSNSEVYTIIKIYNISKNDLKVDIYEKKNDQEEIYITAVEMRKEDNRKIRSRYIRL